MRNPKPDNGQARRAAPPANGPIAVLLRATACLASACFATMLLTGCAGNGLGGNTQDTPLSSKERILAMSALKTGRFSADGRYIMSREERAQSCKRIRGKMNVRIVQLQRTGILRNSSTLARKFGGFFAGKSHGLGSRARRQRDRAILVAYNGLLAEKKCPKIDLDKELNRSAPPATSAKPPRAISPQTR